VMVWNTVKTAQAGRYVPVPIPFHQAKLKSSMTPEGITPAGLTPNAA